MSKKQYILMLGVTLIGGLIGGALSSNVFTGNPALGQKSPRPQKVVIAQEFRLVDKDGKICATLGMSKLSSPELRILTPAYGSRTGVLINSSNSYSSIHLFGESTNISMDVMSIPAINSPGLEEAKLEVGFNPSIKAIKSGKQLNNASIQLNIGEAGGIISGPRLTLTNKRGKTRAVLGRVELEITATGETRERPESSLVFFDRDGKTIWSAP